MARLGLDIDLALQRLLGANKERAAANRAELDDRQRRKDAAAEKAQLASDAPRPGSPTNAEEIRGGTPQLYRAPEPAAQRRKKKDIKIYGMSNTDSFAASGTYEQFAESFTAYAVRSPTSGTFNTVTFPLANSYTIQSTQWRPIFNEELASSRKFYLGDTFTVSNAIKDFEWYFTQKADETFALSGGAAGQLPSPIVASPPTLPFLMESKIYVDESPWFQTQWAAEQTAITRSDGRYIYHSRMIRTAAPLGAILQGRYVNESVYDPGLYESFGRRVIDGATYDYQYTARAAGKSAFLTGTAGFGTTDGWKRPEGPAFSNEFDFSYNSFTLYGLWWRFDSQTNEVVFNSSSLQTAVDSFTEPVRRAAAAWLNGMHPSDPVRRLWNAYKAGYSGLSEYLIVANFLDLPNSFLNRWPETLTYNEANGHLTIVTKLAGWDTPRIFIKEVGSINYGYANISIFELPDNFSPFLTTEQEMTNSGWVNKGLIPQNSLTPLEQYFAFKS